ncbi:hypothetical protein [Paraburkholderia sp. BCC1886]|uniref:hypothetical protein n=1 Tax=Paraburkholderia sp. BCC1886 TaxID=2562670 RepID=UPI0011845BCC|nr:hypothetical protein [Paraburkholderia sp. BCC1886]
MSTSQQPTSPHIKYPEFILAIDTAYAAKIVEKESELVPFPLWTLLDGGKEHLYDTGDQRPNSAIVNRHLLVRQRQGLEKNPAHLQILPYTVFAHLRDDGSIEVPTYFRVKGEGEERLDGKQSLGWGGHPELEDIAWSEQNDIDLRQTIENNVERETNEEVRFLDRDGNEVDAHVVLNGNRHELGFIYDTGDEVGRVHLAVVSIVHVPPGIRVTKREKGHLDGPLMTFAAIAADEKFFEPWSRIVARFHGEALAKAHENLLKAQASLEEIARIQAMTDEEKAAYLEQHRAQVVEQARQISALQETAASQHQQLQDAAERNAQILNGDVQA